VAAPIQQHQEPDMTDKGSRPGGERRYSSVVVDGIAQAPIEGTSFLYTFDPANAAAPSRHRTQYFEMMGQWALYHDGWLLSTQVNRAPWDAFGPANPDPLNKQVLELYDLNTDFSQSRNIADKHPDKVKDLLAKIDRWRKDVGAKMATPNPVYDPAKPNGRGGGRGGPKKAPNKKK